jgi:hypothetical protein
MGDLMKETNRRSSTSATLVSLRRASVRSRLKLLLLIASPSTGAEHDDLFIAGSVLTALFWAISLVLGRWLRHLRRLPGVLRKRERVAAVLSIVFGIIGGFWLIMLR